ncbi:hypothetical protein [Streptomyces sp. B3I7]|nr:hypothetical protein [Streptomyces sp. B3I7]
MVVQTQVSSATPSSSALPAVRTSAKSVASCSRGARTSALSGA